MKLISRSSALKAVMAAVGFAVAGGAQAALTNASTGNGSLFLTAYDTNSNVGYIRDLGTTLDGFLSQIGFDPATGDTVATSGTYVFSTDALFGSTFGSSLDANLQWSIVAADGSNTAGGTVGTSATPHSLRLLTTEQVGQSTTGNSMNMLLSAFNGIMTTKIPTFIDQANAGCEFVGASCDVSAAEVTANYAPGKTTVWGDDYGIAIAGFDNNTTRDGTLEMFYLTGGAGSTFTTQATKTAVAGTEGRGYWTLGLDGTATFTVPGSVSAVPVPAAIWMLGSGLLGFFGVSRRRHSAA